MADGDAQDLFDTLNGSDSLSNPKSHGERLADKVLREMEAARQGEGGLDETDAELLEPELMTACIHMLYEDDDPVDVPIADMKHAIRHPATGVPIMAKYTERISGPTSAIRAKCVWCMGNAPGAIADCTSVNCPLWPFRMGNSPFYGRLVSTDDDADVVEDAAELQALEDEAIAAQTERLAQLRIKEDDNGNS